MAKPTKPEVKEAEVTQDQKSVPAIDQKALEEAALRRVCAAMGVDYNTVVEKEKSAPKPEEMAMFDIGRQTVHINGIAYTGKGQAPKSVVEMIMSMAGNVRMRKLRELIGEERVIDTLAGGSFSSRVIRAYGIEEAVAL